MRFYLRILFVFMQFNMIGMDGIEGAGSLNYILTREAIPAPSFIMARLEGKELFLGVPRSMLGRPMLLVNHHDGNRLEYRNVEWFDYGDRLFLESPSTIESLAGILIPIDKNRSMRNKIIGIFPILKEKSDLKTIWINATGLFLDQIMTGWEENPDQKVIKDQSYIKEIGYYENEIMVKTVQFRSEGREVWVTSIDYSLFLLPQPMEPRPFDYRMGFFSEDGSSSNSINYNTEMAVANITRWRLEKKCKDCSISIPIKPITFVLPPEIPKKWRPYVKAGILEWLPAFEAAGFKNALVIKEAPEKYLDLRFNSVGNSMVRWGNKRNVRGYEDVGGATVSSIVDLRSGEILKSDIFIGASYQNLMDSYFIRCAPLDGRTLEYPFPDELVGRLIQSVVAHEAGHAFGLMDANYGEYTYPFEKMRDKQWLGKMGHTPSIMSYSRYNYIPQPKDSIPPPLLIQKVGPTDAYNIRWAYTPYHSVPLNKQKALLENIVREQDSIPWYRYNKTRHEIIGPGSTNEVVDNNNPIESVKLGLKNMERVLELLSKVRIGQLDPAPQERLYEKILNLWYHQMKQVMSLIGGYEIHYKVGNQSGDMYNPIPHSIQEDAMDFLIVNAFRIPEWLLYPSVMSNIRYSTFPDRPIEYQKRLLRELIGQRRMKRLENMEQGNGYKGISEKMLSKLRSELFKELSENTIKINSRRQEIQRIFIDALLEGLSQKGGQLNSPGNIMYGNSSKSLFMNCLLRLKEDINQSLKKDLDNEIYGHLKLLLYHINKFE